MKHSDVEELARKVGLIEPRDVWADLPSDYRQALCSFSELVLEKAAQVCDGQVERWTDDRARYCASECAAAIRSMAAGMGG